MKGSRYSAGKRNLCHKRGFSSTHLQGWLSASLAGWGEQRKEEGQQLGQEGGGEGESRDDDGKAPVAESLDAIRAQFASPKARQEPHGVSSPI